MARRAALSLTEEMRATLTTISRSRTESAARVRRAQILLAYSGGRRVTHIVREMGATRPPGRAGHRQGIGLRSIAGAERPAAPWPYTAGR